MKDLKATVQWITPSAEAWITTISVPRVGQNPKREKTNQDESDYESRQPCGIESREGAKEKEREREMSERGSQARLTKEIRISWLHATKSMSVCNIITVYININIVFFFFFMTIIVPKQCRFLQQTSNRDTRDNTSAIQAFFPKPDEVSRKGLPRVHGVLATLEFNASNKNSFERPRAGNPLQFI